jgi:hypothetical protein
LLIGLPTNPIETTKPAADVSVAKLKKLQTLHQSQKLNKLPKFMEKDTNGQVRMKRMLYLNNQDEYEASSRTSNTNSFKTDTSWEGVSADSNI